MRVGIFIPAYEAQQTLAAVWQRIPASLEAEAIWIVNDGSADGTAAVARGLMRRDPRVRLIDLPCNRGYGGAVKEGLRAARSAGVDAAVCLHADGQYAPEVLPGLLRTLQDQGLDLLQGSRIASGTALSGGMPLYKLVANRVLTFMENRIFGLEMSDYHSGYLVYGRRALQRIPLEQLSDSFDFDLEVIACARAMGLSIGEQAIPTHYGDEVSHLRSIPYGLRVLRVMFNYHIGRYHQAAPRAL